MSRSRHSRIPDPPAELMDATEWVAASNSWRQTRYLLKDGVWYVQTELGAYEGGELVKIYREHLEAARRLAARRAAWFGFGFGLVVWGGLTFGLHGCGLI